MRSALIAALNSVYRMGAAVHRKLYETRLLPTVSIGVPVIGVGNLSFGGSGKTLVVERIARELIDRGLKVGVVCRSYGAAPGPHLLKGPAPDPYEVGDEAVMLHVSLGDGIASGKDKTAAAAMLAAAHPELHVILVDDAFQHYGLAQDLSILLWPTPGAPLRECPTGADRADVLLVPNGLRSPRAESESVYFVKEITGLDPIRPDSGGARPDIAEVLERPVLAVAGLGPESDFFGQLEKIRVGRHRGTENGRPKLFALALPDHADYRRPEIQARLVSAARGAEAILTTAKDAVKLSRLAIPLPPIYVVRAMVKFVLNEHILWKKILAATS